MKLKIKLTLAFLAFSITPLAVVGYFTFQSSSQAIEENTRKHLIHISTLKETDFERWLSDSQNRLVSLAQRPFVREYTEILVSTPINESTFQSYRAKIIQDHFTPNLDYEGGYTNLSVIRASDGLVLTSTNENIENKYRENRKFFIEGRKQTYIDDVRYDLSFDKAVMHISTPVYGTNDRVIAVLAGHLDLREMALIMSEGMELSSSEETYLVNKFNFFVTESRFLSEAMLIKTAYSDGIEKCLRGEDVFGDFNDYRGVPVVGYYKWIPDRNMCIVSEIDWEEAYRPISDLQIFYLRIGAITLLVVIIFSLIISGSIAISVRDLETGATAISSGNLNYRIKNPSRDEIGAVARAFNRMASSLKKTRNEVAHNQLLLMTLQQAAQSIQQAETPVHIYEAAGREIAKLGYQISIFMGNEKNEKYRIAYLSFESRAIKQIKKLLGISQNKFSFQIKPGGIFHKVIKSGKTVLATDMEKAIEETLPETARKFIPKLPMLLGIKQSVYSLLKSGDQIYGVLVVSGKGFNESDVSAISTFANQMAVALHNANLYQETKKWAVELENRVEQRTGQLKLAQTAGLNMMDDLQREVENRKMIEKEIRKLNAELEQRVIERTAQLEAANNELESFSYSVSHDLRAPLRAMNSFSSILVEEYGKQLPEQAQHYLDLVQKNSHKMGTLIDDLLLFSRTGKQALKIQEIDCVEIVEQALAELQTERNGREIKVVVGKLPPCRADPALIKQVLVNLLSNAFKFTQGKKNARVEIGSKIIKGEKIYFVKDNGVGFDMRYADKLFGVFQRLHSTAEFEGTGVGLAIVQRIIRRHGGKVWAEAQVGKGAVFYFVIGEEDEN